MSSAPASGELLRRERAAAYENPRPEVQALVPRGARRILDLGCSSGALGAELRARQGAHVVGVELDAGYAEDARARLDEVVQADVEELLADERALAGLGRFDCLIAADVLEHLRDPWSVLRRAAELVDPGGAVVVSLPNVRHWGTFYHLGVRGRWPRDPQGVFDATHLRWFTLRDARELLEQAGLDVRAVSPRLRVRLGGSRLDRLATPAIGTPLEQFLAFQYVLGAVRR